MNNSIKTPTLLIDEHQCKMNIAKMADKVKEAKAIFRPHFKTHQSAQIASWFQAHGTDKCTVSSVSMAQYFAKKGWKDITIAFPYNFLEHERISNLAQRIQLNILIESEEALAHANKHLTHSVGYFLKIDVGYHRTGIDHRNTKVIESLVNASNDKVTFKGFLAYSGHTYGAKNQEDIRWIGAQSEKILEPLKNQFGGILSFGDTPSCSLIDDLSVYDELKPGNFVFYDWMQYEMGSNSISEIGVCMACPVVSVHPDREEIVIYGGSVHLSKDSVETKRERHFGKAVVLHEKGWSRSPIGTVVRLSQEHGVIKLSKKAIEEVRVGSLIGVIPVHSCLTADVQSHYLSTSGEQIEKISR